MIFRALWSCRRNVVLQCSRFYSKDLYEPTYLQAMKSKIPIYDVINIQLRGYDFCILESYQKWLNNISKNMNLDVENGWATPAKQLQISSYKPNSEVVNSQFELKVYERTLQINSITSLQLSTLLQVLDSSTPAGVTIKIMPHEDSCEEIRYVPDIELANLKQQLDTLGGPSKK